MNSLASMFFFAVACIAAYQSYHSLRSGPRGAGPNASSPSNGPDFGSARLAGALWGAIALVSALAAFYFDWLAGFDFDWLALPPR
jgi:hypothetical protein